MLYAGAIRRLQSPGGPIIILPIAELGSVAGRPPFVFKELGFAEANGAELHSPAEAGR